MKVLCRSTGDYSYGLARREGKQSCGQQHFPPTKNKHLISCANGHVASHLRQLCFQLFCSTSIRVYSGRCFDIGMTQLHTGGVFLIHKAWGQTSFRFCNICIPCQLRFPNPEDLESEMFHSQKHVRTRNVLAFGAFLNILYLRFSN